MSGASRGGGGGGRSQPAQQQQTQQQLQEQIRQMQDQLLQLQQQQQSSMRAGGGGSAAGGGGDDGAAAAAALPPPPPPALQQLAADETAPEEPPEPLSKKFAAIGTDFKKARRAFARVRTNVAATKEHARKIASQAVVQIKGMAPKVVTPRGGKSAQKRSHADQEDGDDDGESEDEGGGAVAAAAADRPVNEEAVKAAEQHLAQKAVSNLVTAAKWYSRKDPTSYAAAKLNNAKDYYDELLIAFRGAHKDHPFMKELNVRTGKMVPLAFALYTGAFITAGSAASSSSAARAFAHLATSSDSATMRRYISSIEYEGSRMQTTTGHPFEPLVQFTLSAFRSPAFVAGLRAKIDASSSKQVDIAIYDYITRNFLSTAFIYGNANAGQPAEENAVFHTLLTMHKQPRNIEQYLTGDLSPKTALYAAAHFFRDSAPDEFVCETEKELFDAWMRWYLHKGERMNSLPHLRALDVRVFLQKCMGYATRGDFSLETFKHTGYDAFHNAYVVRAWVLDFILRLKSSGHMRRSNALRDLAMNIVHIVVSTLTPVGQLVHAADINAIGEAIANLGDNKGGLGAMDVGYEDDGDDDDTGAAGGGGRAAAAPAFVNPLAEQQRRVDAHLNSRAQGGGAAAAAAVEMQNLRRNAVRTLETFTEKAAQDDYVANLQPHIFAAAFGGGPFFAPLQLTREELQRKKEEEEEARLTEQRREATRAQPIERLIGFLPKKERGAPPYKKRRAGAAAAAYPTALDSPVYYAAHDDENAAGGGGYGGYSGGGASAAAGGGGGSAASAANTHVDYSSYAAAGGGGAAAASAAVPQRPSRAFSVSTMMLQSFNEIDNAAAAAYGGGGGGSVRVRPAGAAAANPYEPPHPLLAPPASLPSATPFPPLPLSPSHLSSPQQPAVPNTATFHAGASPLQQPDYDFGLDLSAELLHDSGFAPAAAMDMPYSNSQYVNPLSTPLINAGADDVGAGGADYITQPNVQGKARGWTKEKQTGPCTNCATAQAPRAACGCFFCDRACEQEGRFLHACN